MSRTAADRGKLIAAMTIFGTIGIVRRFIPCPSSVVALVRAVVGTVFLLLVRAARKEKFPKGALKANLPILCISGVLIGANWIALFEAYRYTTVSVATICYYMAPVFVILAAPVVLKERLTLRKGLCVLAAVFGMVLTSGVLESGISGLTGVLFGLSAAAMYATVMLLNKFVRGLSANDRTVIQLGAAALALLPYVLVTEDMTALTVDVSAIALLALAGIVHTGIAYMLYFGSMEALPAQTVALLAYIDPIVAVVLSMAVLGEQMTGAAIAGVVLVIGAMIWSGKE